MSKNFEQIKKSAKKLTKAEKEALLKALQESSSDSEQVQQDSEEYYQESTDSSSSSSTATDSNTASSSSESYSADLVMKNDFSKPVFIDDAKNLKMLTFKVRFTLQGDLKYSTFNIVVPSSTDKAQYVNLVEAELQTYVDLQNQNYYGIDELEVFNDTIKEIPLNKQAKNLINGREKVRNCRIDRLNEGCDPRFLELKNKDDGYCLFEYIYSMLAGKDRETRLTKADLKREFAEVCGLDSVKFISNQHFEMWAQNRKNISYYILDPLESVVLSHSAEQHPHTCLMFMSNNRHCYPIHNLEAKDSIIKTKTTANIFTTPVWNTGATKARVIKEEEYDDLINGRITDRVALVEKNLRKVSRDIVGCTGASVCDYESRDGDIHSIIHPTSNTLIKFVENHSQLLDALQVLKNEFKVNNFDYNFQTFASVGQQVALCLKALPPRQDYHDDTSRQIIDSNYIKAFVFTNFEKIPEGHKVAFDLKNCYPTAIETNCDDYPIFSVCDSFFKADHEELSNGVVRPGQYLLDGHRIEKYGIVEEPQVVSHNYLRYLLENSLIDVSTVLLFRKCSFSWDKDELKKMFRKIKELLPRSDKSDMRAKSIMNNFIGTYGRKYSPYERVCTTTDKDMCSALYHLYNQPEKNVTVKICEEDDHYFVSVNKRVRNSRDQTGVHIHILSQAKINVLQVLAHRFAENSQLIGIKTDCLYILDPREGGENNIGDVVYTVEPVFKPTKFNAERQKVKHFDTTGLNSLNKFQALPDVTFSGDKIKFNGKEVSAKKLEDLAGRSFICNGGGGCQKTTLLKKLNKINQATALAFTNKAVNNLKESNKWTDSIEKAQTLSSFFFENGHPAGVDFLQIDEYSMVNLTHLECLYEYKRKNPDCVLQFFGDANQCKPVQGDFSRFIDYANTRAFRELCGYQMITKQFVSGDSRYDVSLKEALDYLLKTGKLHKSLMNHPIVDDFDVNICKLNKTRDEINCFFVVDYSDWFIGMPIISEENKKLDEKKISRSEFFKIASLDQEKKTLKVLGMDQELPFSFFRPAYCVTVYKYQGSTIHSPYNIRDVEQMDLNEIYTALSRATKLENIHLDFTDKVFKRNSEPQQPSRHKSVETKKGFIYRLRNDEKMKQYVGQTERSVAERFVEHCEGSKFMEGNPAGWYHSTLGEFVFVNKGLNQIEKSFVVGNQLDNEGYELVNDLLRISYRDLSKRFDRTEADKITIEKLFPIATVTRAKGQTFRTHIDGKQVTSVKKEVLQAKIDSEWSRLMLSFD